MPVQEQMKAYFPNEEQGSIRERLFPELNEPLRDLNTELLEKILAELKSINVQFYKAELREKIRTLPVDIQKQMFELL